MYIDRIREVFERYNYNAQSQMNQQNFYHFLSQLTVLPSTCSPVSPMIAMSPTNSGSRPQEGPTT
jgi:hypothetical protein